MLKTCLLLKAWLACIDGARIYLSVLPLTALGALTALAFLHEVPRACITFHIYHTRTRQVFCAAQADLADRDFSAEKQQVMVISTGNNKALTAKDKERNAAQRHAAEQRHQHRYVHAACAVEKLSINRLLALACSRQSGFQCKTRTADAV